MANQDSAFTIRVRDQRGLTVPPAAGGVVGCPGAIAITSASHLGDPRLPVGGRRYRGLMNMRRALVVTALCAAGVGTVFAVSGSATASPTPGSGFSSVKCTDQADYAGDHRSDAEINSIGFATG